MARPYVLTLKQAQIDAGKVSTRNSKMPGSTLALDAFACKVGEKLSKVPGSVCSGCYARRIQKMRPSVQSGWSSNQAIAESMLKVDPEKWINALVFQIERAALKFEQAAEKRYQESVNEIWTLHKIKVISASRRGKLMAAEKKRFDAVKYKERYHRWFDSGDLDSHIMLDAICEVARRTSNIKHWLPTREVGIVSNYIKAGNAIPGNLRIRLSSTMINDKPLTSAKRLGVSTSTVHTKGKELPEHGHICPASGQGNACQDCRYCWESSGNVSYPKH